MDCLIIKSPYIDLILSGVKTWEIRGSRTHKRGKIGLIKSGSGTIIGEVELVDCVGPLSLQEFLNNKNKHQSSSKTLMYKKTYAWVIKNPKKFDVAKKYKHPMGAVIWVKV